MKKIKINYILILDIPCILYYQLVQQPGELPVHFHKSYLISL